jgi:hypothetical protein
LRSEVPEEMPVKGHQPVFHRVSVHATHSD